MPHRRTLATLVLLAAAVLPLASCAPPDRALDDGTHVIVAEAHSGPLVALYAIIEGTLVEVDGCLGIEHAGGQSFPVVFPAGSSVTGSRISVAGFDGSFEIGDWISGGGGTVPLAEDAYPDAPCRSDDIVLLNDGRAN